MGHTVSGIGEIGRGDPGGETARGPRVAVWGTFDVANFGDLLFPRIFEHELRRRLPSVDVRAFAPLGSLHPVALDGGRAAEPLAPWSDERAARLAEELDLIAIGGGEIIHTNDDFYAVWYERDTPELKELRPSELFIEGLGPDLERVSPVVWHSVGIPFDLEGIAGARVRAALATRPYVSVRDEISRERLLRAGVEREVEVVPDSGFVVDRILPRQVLAKRLEYLRALAAYPSSEPPLVVQGSAALLPFVDDIGRGLAQALDDAGSVPVVLLETGPCHGDRRFTDALAPHLRRPAHRMPAGASIEDIAAAIAHARGFVGISLHGNVTAVVHGVPNTILNLVGYSKLDALADLIGGGRHGLVSSIDDLFPAVNRTLAGESPAADLAPIVHRVDAHFDKLAEIAEAAASRRSNGHALTEAGAEGSQPAEALRAANERYESLKQAYAVRGRRIVDERLRLAEVVDALEERHRLRDAELEQRLADTAASAQTLEQRLAESERLLAGARAELAALGVRLASAQQEIEQIKATKLFRYAAPVRALYARLLRRTR